MEPVGPPPIITGGGKVDALVFMVRAADRRLMEWENEGRTAESDLKGVWRRYKGGAVAKQGVLGIAIDVGTVHMNSNSHHR